MSEIFGTYELHEKVAQGGMAEVFLASKRGEIGGFERRLAIKRVFPHLVDREEIINMFIDEARIASRLNHPNIVQIYDLGVVDNQFFIAMEYVEGMDLRQLCEVGVAKKNFISRPLAVYVASQVAAGLDYAHRRADEQGRPMNIIHRDVSPQNVLISVDGAVKLCDFGIAKAESRITETQVGEFKGKFSYMSPEQFGSTHLDHRSDIFTLGIVLYETTVAARLFRSSSEYEAMRRITEGDFRPPSAMRPDYPPQLERIVLQALSLDPADRYQTAGAMHEALEEWLFEQRLRTGPRKLAAYLREVMAKPTSQATPSAATGPQMPSPMPESAADGEGDDATVQMTMTEEALERLDGEDPTIQDSMSQGRLEALGEQDGFAPPSDDDPTVPDVHPPSFSDALRQTKEADAVEIRRISPEEARQRRHSGAQGVEISEDFTTNPIQETRRDAEGDGNDSSPGSREITGQWAEERRRQGHGTPGALSRPRLADEEPAIPQTPKKRGPKKEEPSSMSSLIGKLPDLRPGGRSLTGLNEIREGREAGGKPTAAIAAVSGPTNHGEKTRFPLRTALIVIAVGALVAVIATTAILGLLGDDGEAMAEQEELDYAVAEPESITPAGMTVGDEEVTLLLETSPSGAKVVANGVVVEGQTPLEVPLVAGRDNEVWIMSSRYRPHRLLIPAHEQGMERTVALERAASTEGATVEFHSEPEGAKVLLNGDLLGEAPFRMANVRTDAPVHVQFEMEGYRPYVAFLELRADDHQRLEVVLPASNEEVVEGTYEFSPRGSRVLREGELLAATPFGERHHRQEWLELEVQGDQRQSQHHRLRLDKIGGFTMAFRLAEEATATGTFSVDVDPMAAVYVGHRAFGTAPVEEVELPAGEQTVVLETVDGKRVRVAVEIEADRHQSYRVEIDGEDVDLERLSD